VDSDLQNFKAPSVTLCVILPHHTKVVRLSIELWENRRTDENRNGTMKCWSLMGLSWGLVGVYRVRERKRERRKKYAFRRAGRYTFIISRTFDEGATVSLCTVIAFRRARGLVG